MKIQKLKPEKVLDDVLKKNDKFITDEVKYRLNEKGERSTGEKIYTYKAIVEGKRDVYAYATIVGVPGRFKGKKEKGQRYDNVTFKDTGKFQKSFELQLQKTFFNIKGDSKKKEGDIDRNVDMTNVLNLSNEEKSNIVNEIKDDYISGIRQAINI